MRTEYINTNISIRDLAAKHGVSESAALKKSAKEKWKEQREEQRIKCESKVNQKTAEVVSDSHAQRISLLMKGGEKAARLLLKNLDDMEKSGEISPYAIKVTVEAMKGIRDLYKADDGTPDAKLQRARELLGGVPNALDG